jgi:hypothetical protein
MQMRMDQQGLVPTMQGCQHARQCAQILGIGQQLAKRLDSGPEQRVRERLS